MATQHPLDCTPLDYFLWGVSNLKGQFKASQQNQGPDPKDHGSDGHGHPRKEYQGEGLQEVQVREERLPLLLATVY